MNKVRDVRKRGLCVAGGSSGIGAPSLVIIIFAGGGSGGGGGALMLCVVRVHVADITITQQTECLLLVDCDSWQRVEYFECRQRDVALRWRRRAHRAAFVRARIFAITNKLLLV